MPRTDSHAGSRRLQVRLGQQHVSRRRGQLIERHAHWKLDARRTVRHMDLDDPRPAISARVGRIEQVELAHPSVTAERGDSARARVREIDGARLHDDHAAGSTTRPSADAVDTEHVLASAAVSAVAADPAVRTDLDLRCVDHAETATAASTKVLARGRESGLRRKRRSHHRVPAAFAAATRERLREFADNDRLRDGIDRPRSLGDSAVMRNDDGQSRRRGPRN
jgi:hypothetical protein